MQLNEKKKSSCYEAVTCDNSTFKVKSLITLFLKSIILILVDFLVVIWARDGHDTNFASLEILESPEASPRVNFILGDFLLVK